MAARPSCRACGGRGHEGAACARCGDLGAQAEDWLSLQCDDLHRAPSHPQDSHAELFKAACILVKGFALPHATARAYLQAYAQRSDAPWTETELEHKLRSAEAAADAKPPGYLIWEGRNGATGNGDSRPSAPAGAEVAPPRETLEQEIQRHARAKDFDPPHLGTGIRRELKVDEAYLRERSPIDPEAVRRPEDYLAALYGHDEIVLIFTYYQSQGQYAMWMGNDERDNQVIRLSNIPRERGKRVEALPTSAPGGMWYLNQPVDGKWYPKDMRERQVGDNGEARYVRTETKLSRRSWPSVTAWRYLVLESDEGGIEAEWLQQMADMKLPVAALYTSGGRSVHALIKLEAPNKQAFDLLARGFLMPWLTQRGADKGVFTGVRLTRLPCCWREGSYEGKELRRYATPRRQQLLYLNPFATHQPINELPRLRDVRS